MKSFKIDLKTTDTEALQKAARHLHAGGVLIFPTETFYGLFARLDRPEAMERIVSLKGREATKAMPCLASGYLMARNAFDPPPPGLDRLAERFWPGPLTIIGRARHELIGRATGGGKTIGVRVPGSLAARRLVGICGFVLTATSANPSGDEPVLSGEDALRYFKSEEDLVLFDGGRLPPSKGSTVIDMTTEPPNVIRKGDLSTEMIEFALGRGLSEIIVHDDEKLQELVRAPLRILQKASGFRYSIDALLLASFVDFNPGERIVDIGSGTGVIPLILADRGATQILGLEIQAELVDMSQRSILANGLHERARIIHGDARNVRELFAPGSFDVVVSNPPYFPMGTGHLSPDDARAASRHELTLSLPELIASSAYLLREGGRLCLIHLASREKELIDLMHKEGLAPSLLQRVIPKAGDEPKFILMKGIKSGSEEFEVLPPLILHDESGEYTNEVTRMIRSSV